MQIGETIILQYSSKEWSSIHPEIRGYCWSEGFYKGDSFIIKNIGYPHMGSLRKEWQILNLIEVQKKGQDYGQWIPDNAFINSNPLVTYLMSL